MAPPELTVTVVDEGYFKKSFTLSTNTSLEQLIDRYCAYICAECSDMRLLDFWYETTKITEGLTGKMLGIDSGDIIDVRVAEQCTRGTCPLPIGLTLPNIHYLCHTPAPRTEAQALQVRESEEEPRAPKRIKLRFHDINGKDMMFTLKVDTKLSYPMKAFTTEVGRELDTCRFAVDSIRVFQHQTPEELNEKLDGGLEDGDQVDVFYRVRGGYGVMTES